MATAGRTPVAVDKMHVTNVLTVSAQTIGDSPLLNIHVKQVCKNDDIIRVECAQECNRLLSSAP